jgi:hypothetical protein
VTARRILNDGTLSVQQTAKLFSLRVPQTFDAGNVHVAQNYVVISDRVAAPAHDEIAPLPRFNDSKGTNFAKHVIAADRDTLRASKLSQQDFAHALAAERDCALCEVTACARARRPFNSPAVFKFKSILNGHRGIDNGPNLHLEQLIQLRCERETDAVNVVGEYSRLPSRYVHNNLEKSDAKVRP